MGELVLVTAEETWWGKPSHLDSEETNEPECVLVVATDFIRDNQNTNIDEKNKPKPSERRLYTRKVSAYLANKERKQAVFVKEAFVKPESSEDRIVTTFRKRSHNPIRSITWLEPDTTSALHSVSAEVFSCIAHRLPLTLRNYFRKTDIRTSYQPSARI